MTSDQGKDPAAFGDLPARIQALLGQTIVVEFAQGSKLFFGIRFTATLERVETVKEKTGALILHFSNGAELDLAPGEVASAITIGSGLALFVGPGGSVVEFLPQDAQGWRSRVRTHA
jgi:hypothetical protein